MLFLFLKKIFTKKENQILYAEGEIVNLLLEENKRSKKKPTGKTEKKDVDKLISLLLNAKDVETRKGLISEIGNLGNAKAIDPLINLLKDSDEFVRVYAAKALGRIGNSSNVIEALNNAKSLASTDIQFHFDGELGEFRGHHT